MADVNFPLARAVAEPDGKSIADGEAIAAAPFYDVIELLFFAYRDFVADADNLLEAYGFGRAHHRVLHFVDRNPGLTVAELLDILKITKQSLGRVLKELIDQGFVLQREGEADRRRRLLTTTAKGKALAGDLAALQTRRIASALATLGPGGHAVATRFLFALIDPEERSSVEHLVGPMGAARGSR
jgi:DNA-binding MarR family transcriptional regulator